MIGVRTVSGLRTAQQERLHLGVCQAAGNDQQAGKDSAKCFTLIFKQVKGAGQPCMHTVSTWEQA